MADALIDPRKLINDLTPEELCQTAEEYYAVITDPTPQLAKPFSGILESPDLLYKMGLLLSGLRLGRSMTVLDFGAGTCWFSRYLNQMGCATISVDASETALALGRRLFEEHPVIGAAPADPEFLVFDGYTIDLPDESVDRIVCYDVFHHVPNQETILTEFHRVLKPGGIVGFSEPGPHHSQSAMSQYEMRTYNVLENDIRLDEIAAITDRIGFSELRVKPISPTGLEFDLAEYQTVLGPTQRPLYERVLGRLTKFRRSSAPVDRLTQQSIDALRSSTVFYVTKGVYRPDSRNPEGLLASLEIAGTPPAAVGAGEPLQISINATNSGSSRWLSDASLTVGLVNGGAHLFKADGTLVDLDFARAPIGQDLGPGDSTTIDFDLRIDEPGNYRLVFDLVVEGVAWFEILGSKTIAVDIMVTT